VRYRLPAGELFIHRSGATADKLQVAEADGAGPVQSFLSDTARELKMWDPGRYHRHRGDSRASGCQRVAVDRCRRQAGGTL